MTHIALRSLAGAVAVLGIAGILSSAPARQDVKPDVHFVPTPTEVVDRMLELAEPKAGELLMDLGSGDGRIPITAVQRYGVRAIGIDIDPKRIEEANANAKEAGVQDKVEFRQENLFETEIRNANVVTLYLLETLNAKLRPRLLEELEPGTRIVSHAFSMGEWEPDQHERIGVRNVYFWIVPARVEGRWRLENGDSEGVIDLDLKQSFQILTGSAQVNGRSVPIHDGRLDGRQITFKLDGRAYRGTVDGDTIRAADGADAKWQAVRS